MPKKKLRSVRVGSIADFAKEVERLLPPDSAGNWYRGISKSSYTLTPGLLRHPSVIDLEGLLRLESNMLEDFERHSVLHTGDMAGTGADADFKKLFFMQHYGIPTRLLDWSSNPFIALYFALSTAQLASGATAPADDAVVWVVNPVAWNRAALEHVSFGDAGPLKHTDAISGYGPRRLFAGEFEPSAIKTLNQWPVCILGITNSARMFAQRGVFTILGKDLRPMEEQWTAGKFGSDALARIVIPKDRIFSMLSSVLRLGYTDSVSYPDLHGLAMEIKRSRGFRT